MSDTILKKMNRRSTYNSICSLLDKIKAQKVKIAIRSSFIVGFPYEKSKDFNLLKNFIKKYKMDNVGVFEYSREEGTPAYSMPKQIPNLIKKIRRKKIYNIQKRIAEKNNQDYVGQTLLCVLDNIEDDVLIMRNQYNSPNVDTVVYCEPIDGVEQGAFYEVKILAYSEYDLIGEIVKRS